MTDTETFPTETFPTQGETVEPSIPLSSMPQRDRFATRVVVLILGAIALEALTFAGAMSMQKIKVPSEMWMVLTTALGIIGGILSTTRSSGGGK